jgi:hypothetical protein
VSQYEEPSTPELNDLQQNNEHEAVIEVPVRVVDIGPVQVHTLPSRDAVMRSVTVDGNVQQIVGANLRRSKITVWATADVADQFVFIGTDKNEVESGTAARLPATILGTPVMLTMHHAVQLWVMTTGAEPVILSFVSEDWAD